MSVNAIMNWCHETPSKADAAKVFQPFKVKGKTVSVSHIQRAIVWMEGRTDFTNMQIAGALTRAGFNVGGDSWDDQEAANRLLQRFRKLGLVKFNNKTWSLAI